VIVSAAIVSLYNLSDTNKILLSVNTAEYNVNTFSKLNHLQRVLNGKSCIGALFGGGREKRNGTFFSTKDSRPPPTLLLDDQGHELR
jgi:hypothetical protein